MSASLYPARTAAPSTAPIWEPAALPGALPVSLPVSLDAPAPAWRSWLGLAFSGAILIAALVQLRTLDVRQMLALLPRTGGFWLAFAATYLTLPATEWLIYRRLWRLPAGGFVPLLRKRLSNELVLGYSGEVYFYQWARRRAGLTAAPFAAIKDVAILSAQTGNAATLLLLGMAWPLLGALHLGIGGRDMMLAAGGVVLMSLLPILVRRHLLSLPAAMLWRIAALHGARIAIELAATAWLWHSALPMVAMSWWVILVALRQLLSRLPLMPNKDIVFAGLAAYLVGPRAGLAEVIALAASLTLAMHVLLGILLSGADLARTPQPGA